MRAAGALCRALFGGSVAGWLAPLVAPYMGPLGLLLLLSLAAAGAALLPPYLTKLIIDEGLIAGDARALVAYTAAFFAFGLAALLLAAVNNVLHLRLSARMLVDLRGWLFDHVLRLSPRWHAGMRTGEALSRFDGDAGEVQQFTFNALLTGAGAVLRLLGGLGMVFVLEWRLALLAVLLAPVELVFLRWARPRTERHAHAVRARRGALAAFIAESLAHLPLLQALAAEPARRAGLAAAQQGLLAQLLAAQRWQELTRIVPLTGVAALRAVIFVIGGLWVVDGRWPLGSLIAFTAYLGFLVGPMGSLLGLYHAQARVKASVARLSELAAAVPEVRDPETPAPLPPGRGELRLAAATLTHPGLARPVLHDLSVRFPAGAKCRLAGASGIGKSSLIGLLQRHYDPDAGAVLLDGVDLRRLSLAELRGAIRVVPQTAALLHGSILDNLRLADPAADEAAVWAALETVGLADWARRLPAGLATPVGERGQDLSGGERQRLALARGLLRPFRVLVLDESLSEVDGEAVRAIMQAIDRRYGDRTRIVVSHGAAALYGPFDVTVDLQAAAGRAAS